MCTVVHVLYTGGHDIVLHRLKEDQIEALLVHLLILNINDT